MKRIRATPKSESGKKRVKQDDSDGDDAILGKMSFVYKHEKTVGGPYVDECISALQKHIRRGEAHEAVKCAFELYAFMMVRRGAKFASQFLNRLWTISLEDVSLANVAAVICTESRLEVLEGHRRVGMVTTVEKQAILDIVWGLATGKHCRISSLLNAAFCKDEMLPELERLDPESHRQLRIAKGELPCPLPEKTFGFSAAERQDPQLVDIVNRMVYCLEQRWPAGFGPLSELMARATGPTKHARSFNTVFLALDIFDWFFRTAHPDWLVGESKRLMGKFFGAISRRCKAMISHREAPPLGLRNVYLALAMSDKVDWDREAQLPPVEFDAGALFQLNIDGSAIDHIADYAIDKHTKRGRKAGATDQDFAQSGSLVSDEDANFADPVFKALYLKSKRVAVPDDDIFPRESDLFVPIVRLQLVTSDSKQDTYLAKTGRAVGPFAEGERVFVKGPFLPRTENRADLAVAEMAVFRAVPSESMVGPIGCRKLALERVCDFLVCSDLLGSVENVPVRIRSSKCWPPTHVVDFDAVPEVKTAVPAELNDDELERFVLAHCFRHIFQVNDPAARNILVESDTGAIFSVDEDSTSLGRRAAPTGIKLVPGSKRLAIVQGYIAMPDNLDEILRILKGWVRKMSNDAQVQALLEKLPSHTCPLANIRMLISSRLKSAFF